MERESQSVLLNLQLVKGRVNHTAVVEISNRLLLIFVLACYVSAISTPLCVTTLSLLGNLARAVPIVSLEST